MILFPSASQKVINGAVGILLGIGNIGVEYDKTRHNVGFDTIDALAAGAGSTFVDFGHSKITAILVPGGKKIVLCKPQTYVNRSGVAARELLAAAELTPAACLVAVDDLNLALGAVRIRSKGSAGGHNGLKSLIAELGDEFPRIRMGIGSPPPGGSIIDFVLGRFAEEDRSVVDLLVKTSSEAAVHFFAEGLESAMNRYSGNVVTV